MAAHRSASECPLYPQKRTLVEPIGMSALYQKRTFEIRSLANLSSNSGGGSAARREASMLAAATTFLQLRQHLVEREAPGLLPRWEVGVSL